MWLYDLMSPYHQMHVFKTILCDQSVQNTFMLDISYLCLHIYFILLSVYTFYKLLTSNNLLYERNVPATCLLLVNRRFKLIVSLLRQAEELSIHSCGLWVYGGFGLSYSGGFCFYSHSFSATGRRTPFYCVSCILLPSSASLILFPFLPFLPYIPFLPCFHSMGLSPSLGILNMAMAFIPCMFY